MRPESRRQQANLRADVLPHSAAAFTNCSSRERERDRLTPGSIRGFPDMWNKWCQSDLKRNPKLPSAGINHRIPTKHQIQLLPETQNCQHPTSKDSHWQRESPGVKSSRAEPKHPFPMSAPRGAGKQLSWNTLALQRMSRTALVS